MALTGPALVLHDALRTTVVDASGGDAEGFERSARLVANLDAEHVRLVLGHVVRSLVEELHPDGVEADDVSALLDGCTTGSRWCPSVDEAVLVAVVAGALGVHADEPGVLPPSEVARHACLLVAYLLRARGGRVDRYLTDAFTELARAQTVEMP